ncbi:MAG: ATP-binding protein [Armatimonadota bacterium]
MESDATAPLQDPRQLAIGDGVYGLDPQGFCTFINPAAAEMLGYRAEELLGRELHALIHHTRADGSPYRLEECPIAGSLWTGEPVRLDDELLWRRDGTSFRAEYSAYPLRTGDAVQGAVVVFRDSSAAQSERERLSAALQRAHQERQELLERERLARQAAERERDLLLRVTENAPISIGVLEGPEHRFTFVNSVTADLCGLPVEAFLGRTHREVAPEADAVVGPVLDRVFRTGQPEVMPDLEVRLPNGRQASLHVIWTPLQGPDGTLAGVLYLSLDTTELRRAQEALRTAHDSFRHLVQNSPFGLYAVDADFRLVQVSAGAQKVFENVQPLLGRDFAAVLRAIWPEPFATEAIGYFRHTLATGEPYHAPSTVERRRDIDEVEAYDWKIERVTLPDGRYGVVCHFYDLSERQQYEEALRDADRRKDEFLAMLAHELRNPLGAIRNAVGLLQQAEPGSAPFRRGLEVARRQIQHQSQIVDDLLDVSRIRSGKLELRREQLDLTELVRDTAEDFRAEVERRGLALTVALPDEPVSVQGDRTRLAQALGNLLNNASKFTPAGGEVRIELETRPSEKRSEMAEIRVRDTGVGIDPEMLARLFEPFTQADRSLDRSCGGLGLGLSLVRGLVEMHGGQVHGRSAGEGRGAEFTLTLPVSAAPLGEPARRAAVTSNSGSQRVLVVEDLPDAAETLRDLLELAGYTVEVASDGPAALASAAAFRPNVVLCDIGLPGMDGYSVAEELRRRAATAESYLIALTGYGQEADRHRAETAGFNLHLTKPVEPEALYRVLASLAAA